MAKAGRPKGSGGSKHTHTIMGSLNSATLERIADRYNTTPSLLTPLDIFVEVMNSTKITGLKKGEVWKLRLFAAEKAAPYFHWKMPESLELSGPDGGPIDINNSRAAIEDKLFGGPVMTAEVTELPAPSNNNNELLALESRIPEKV